MAEGLSKEQIAFLSKYLNVTFDLNPTDLDSAVKLEIANLLKQLDADLKKLRDRHLDVLQAQAEYGNLTDTWGERINEAKKFLDKDKESGSQLNGLKANLLQIVPELKALVERLHEQLGSHDKVEASYAAGIAKCDALLVDIRALRPQLTAWNTLGAQLTAQVDPNPFEREYERVLVKANRAKQEWKQAQGSGKLDEKQAAVLPIEDIRKSLDAEKQRLAGLVASMSGIIASATTIEQEAVRIKPWLTHLERKGVQHPGVDLVSMDLLFVTAAAALRDYDAGAMTAVSVAMKKIGTDAEALLESSPLASDQVALGKLKTLGDQKLCEQLKQGLENRLATLEADAAGLKSKIDAGEFDQIDTDIKLQKTNVAAKFDWSKVGGADKQAYLHKSHEEISREVDSIERELTTLEVTLDPTERPTVAWEKFEKFHNGSVQNGINVDPWDPANKEVPLCVELIELKKRALDSSETTPDRFDCIERSKKIVFKARAQILAQPSVNDSAGVASTYHKEAEALRTRIVAVKDSPLFKETVGSKPKFKKGHETLEKYFSEAELYLSRGTTEALESARRIVKQAEDFAKTAPLSGTPEENAVALKEQLANKEESAKLEKELLAMWPLYHSAEDVDKNETKVAVGGAASFDELHTQAGLDRQKIKVYRKALALIVRQAYANWEKMRREYQGHAKRAERILEGFEAELKNDDGHILSEAASPGAKEIQALLSTAASGDSVKTMVEAVNTAYEDACVKANDGQYDAARELLKSIKPKIDDISKAVAAQREAALDAISNPPDGVDLEWKPLQTKTKDSGYGFNTTIDSVNYQSGQVINANGELVASPELQEMAKNLDYRLTQMEKLCALGEDPLDVAHRVFDGIPENFWPPRAMKLIAMFRAAEAEFAEEQLRAEAEKFLGKNDLAKGVDELRDAVEVAKKPLTIKQYEDSLAPDKRAVFKELGAEAQKQMADAGGIMALFGDPTTGSGKAADAVAKGQLKDVGVLTSKDVGTAANSIAVVNSGLNVVRAGYALCDAQVNLSKENKKDDFQARSEDELLSPVQKRIFEYERMRALAQLANSSIDLILNSINLGLGTPGLGIVGNAKDMAIAFGEAGRYFAMLEDTDWARRASKKDPDSITYLGLKMQAKEEGYAGGKQCFTAAIKILAITGDAVTLAGVSAPVGFAINAGAKVLEFGGNIVFKLKDWGDVSHQQAVIKRAKESPPDYQAIEEVFTDTRKYARFCIAWNCLRGDPWARSWVLNRGLTESDMDNATTTTRIIREYINVTQQGVLGDTEDDMEQAFEDSLGARAAKAVGRGVAAGPKAAAKWVEDKSLGRDRSKERDYFQIGKKGTETWATYWAAEQTKACDAGLFITKDLNRFKKHFEVLDASQAELRKELILGDAAEPDKVRPCIEEARQAFAALNAHISGYSPIANDQQPHRGAIDLLRYLRMELSREEVRFNTNVKAFEAGQLLLQTSPQLAGEIQDKMKALSMVREDENKSADDLELAEAELEALLDDQTIAQANDEILNAAQVELQENVRQFQEQSLALTKELLAKVKLKTSFGDLSPKTSSDSWVSDTECEKFCVGIDKKLKLKDKQKTPARKRFGNVFEQLEKDFAALPGQLAGVKASYVVDKVTKVRTMSVEGKVDSAGGKWVFKDVYKKELQRHLKTVDSAFAKEIGKAASDVLTYELNADGETDDQSALSDTGKKLDWNLKGEITSPFASADNLSGAAQKWSGDKKDAVAKGWVSTKTGLKAKIVTFATKHATLLNAVKAEAPDKLVQGNWRIELANLQTTLEQLSVLTKHKTTHPGMANYKAACQKDLKTLEEKTLDKVAKMVAKTQWVPPDSYFKDTFFTKMQCGRFLTTCQKRWNLNLKTVPKSLLKSVETAERRLDIWENADQSIQSEELTRYFDKAVNTLGEMKTEFNKPSFKPMTKGKPPAEHVSVERMKTVCPGVIDGMIRKVHTEHGKADPP